jgi:hypothetical protein
MCEPRNRGLERERDGSEVKKLSSSRATVVCVTGLPPTHAWSIGTNSKVSEWWIDICSYYLVTRMSTAAPELEEPKTYSKGPEETHPHPRRIKFYLLLKCLLKMSAWIVPHLIGSNCIRLSQISQNAPGPTSPLKWRRDSGGGSSFTFC